MIREYRKSVSMVCELKLKLSISIRQFAYITFACIPVCVHDYKTGHSKLST